MSSVINEWIIHKWMTSDLYREEILNSEDTTTVEIILSNLDNFDDNELNKLTNIMSKHAINSYSFLKCENASSKIRQIVYDKSKYRLFNVYGINSIINDIFYPSTLLQQNEMLVKDIIKNNDYRMARAVLDNSILINLSKAESELLESLVIIGKLNLKFD